MDLKSRIILEDYRKNRDDFVKIGEIVHKKLDAIAAESGIRTFQVQHRVKGEKSLAGKLIRRGGWYDSFEQLTDIMGARVICYFNDDVDRMGALVEKEFVVDRENSSDKRQLIDAESFGYLSLHYIASLPKSDEYPEELCHWRFEIQIRTCLQHIWSDIEHDTGYKSEFGVPRAVQRGYARISALLELADDEFVRMRDLMSDYTESVRQSIIDDTAEDVPIDTVSLNEYVRNNKRMRALLALMAADSGAQIEECDPGAYVAQLDWLGIKTIGGISRMLAQNEEMACRLLSRALESTDLDIISSSTGLRYLCNAEVCRRELSTEEIGEFLALGLSNAGRAQTRAKYLKRVYEELSE